MKIKLVSPRFMLTTPLDEIATFPAKIEHAGRICYRSHDRMKEGSADRFVRMILKRGHESVLEHVSMSAEIVCDRSTSHQIVRHRLCAFSQESQRYCAYEGDPLEVICPPSIEGNDKLFENWKQTMHSSMVLYEHMRKNGITAEDSRSVFTNATATRIAWTANLREWRHIFNLRVDHHAQWQIRALMTDFLTQVNEVAPVLVEDLWHRHILKDEEEWRQWDKDMYNQWAEAGRPRPL